MRVRSGGSEGSKERDQDEQEIDEVVGDEVFLVRCEIEPDAEFEHERDPDTVGASWPDVSAPS